MLTPEPCLGGSQFAQTKSLPGAGGNFMSEPGPGIASFTGGDPAKGLEEKEAERKTLP